ncbi:MAG: bifunctional pyr operon transcriptional regulator/uracil phosphoribosyltransferase PyrR [Comamonadaceae bacterium]|mgnify:CR=1 FL=1|uniref:Bifunctional pyr operon transcriptional regulator/uracil phosphoribosyltransferase PyrR n=1 Tax=Hydrogenophaga borbori TaxID=2294117 RepID=A0A372EHV8_9BURK|nr:MULTISPECIES: bifunctional pyr operon transcriptional regulator/uracil phosphoribosyltransferase PyrR [Hydrogenophaga]NCT97153.1 bifunctional pyr operon transcriptional regulator/uracil phosphoribosyltransferase PyrR [Comamonadaceae bacterium]RFP78113.1 bifunctional pyr operon transcriptional regulator/uracil phosphoribosyltransferase PyrR [Hydrogenophaga borbori]WQB82699.1 bifunctional pyr operon transcriptional regulator/uracil phosphoribosyltransferase PyrR [Hydrogenophaga sp. SNF1]
MTPPDAEALYAQLLTRVRAVLEAEPATRLVGIATGGAWIAERLHADLKQPGACGVVSSVMHRDDFARRGLASSVQTRLPFEVDGASLLLIDDVLYTGRTLRAVLNELFDHGRPASVRLAVLVDRGGRQLPIEAQLSMARVEVPAGQSLELARDGDGRLRFVLESQT